MTKKSYESTQYFSQRLYDAFRQIFSQSTGADNFGLNYHYSEGGNEDVSEGFISFDIAGHHSEIVVSKQGRKSLYNAVHTVDGDVAFLYGEPSFDGIRRMEYEAIRPFRSKVGRIGDESARDIAKFFLNDINELDRK